MLTAASPFDGIINRNASLNTALYYFHIFEILDLELFIADTLEKLY
jgi:hypothetical protein